ncbi:hypothetical protein D9757_008540 [Collybiopsis confluens]|uniref:peptidylprolyl isomerase n=1 Tax=Collybiopsis confluens TaxID=2823264 RepID=A0A8H5H2X3_9AGAR|nr:hypothetical protein D9757_008540 [Collybiopsis confluens]
MVRPRVFFDFAVDNQPIGRVIFELFNDSAPKTAEKYLLSLPLHFCHFDSYSFRALCTGEHGRTPSDALLYYKNSIIHRSINDFMIQGGDFTKRNGSGGESIYGGTFPDEDLTRPLDAEALLCMANRGPDTNGSQFFITLRPCPHLNGKHVVFGRVLRGYDDVLNKIAQLPVDNKDRPLNSVLIQNCGELELRKQPPPAKREAEEEKEKEEEKETRKPRRSRSPSSDHSDSSVKPHQRKKSKRKHKRESNDKAVKANNGETEEEYDARLEREEKERIEAERKRELERLKIKYEESESHVKDGVRFKGRGRMKFMDPDVHFR